jgi:triacylglycerol lipase
MGHSAGAAHVAQYLGHPQVHIAPSSGLVGAIMVSGLFDPATAEANPPLRAYFGSDPARYEERSALPGMAKTKLSMLLAVAELDPLDFLAQLEQARASLCGAGACPQTIKLLGHNHMSEVFSINTNDQVLTGALSAFINAR